jgi:hypothetical protein
MAIYTVQRLKHGECVARRGRTDRGSRAEGVQEPTPEVLTFTPLFEVMIYREGVGHPYT